jgi:hypothetical protein
MLATRLSDTVTGCAKHISMPEMKGGNDVSGAQVKIEEAKVKKDGSDTWGPTDIVARTNMSWGDKPDRHSDKYGGVQLAPGSEVIDFINGPHLATIKTNNNIFRAKAFLIRIDPQQAVNPVCFEKGQYRFVMQVSALNAQLDRLTLLVDWDGNDFVIRSENGQVLEPASSS